MKAIATIIAVILMVLLVITLASLAAMFIMGYFRARIAVVLTITEARCNSTHFMVDVRNEGTDTSSIVTVIVINATGAEISGSIPSIPPLMIKTVTICRDPVCGAPLGFAVPAMPPYFQLYRIRVVSPGVTPTAAHVLC